MTTPTSQPPPPQTTTAAGRRSSIAMLTWLLVGIVVSLLAQNFLIGFGVGLLASLLAWQLTARR